MQRKLATSFACVHVDSTHNFGHNSPPTYGQGLKVYSTKHGPNKDGKIPFDIAKFFKVPMPLIAADFNMSGFRVIMSTALFVNQSCKRFLAS